MVGTIMSKTRLPQHIGSRISLDGRVGTLLSFVHHSKYSGFKTEDRSWVVVFDDEPDSIALIAENDKPRVLDVTPKLEPTSINGRPGYALELPTGTHRVFKRGAYWFYIKPDALLPRSNEYSGINTRQGAVDSALGHHARMVDPRNSR
jgi:hypothetical protein